VAALPSDVALGPVRLRVADAERSGEWLERVLGMRPLGSASGRAGFGVQGRRPLVELREQRGARRVPRGGRPGIYHYALLLPSRADLGRFLLELDRIGEPHADSDHLVSEAIYLVDPDGITVEIYADRPRERWTMRGDQIEMATLPLDRDGVAGAAGGTRWDGLPDGARMGHVHFHVGDLAAAERFYVQGLGFGVTQRGYPGALFAAAGGYHHHVAVNTWAASRASAGPDDAGLDEWLLVVPDAGARQALDARMRGLGLEPARDGEAWSVSDPWGITVRVTGS